MINLSAIIASFICLSLNLLDCGIKAALKEFIREVKHEWILKL